MDTDEYYTPTASEKELLRYYYYIKNGVDTVHVAPIDEKVLVRVSIKYFHIDYLKFVKHYKYQYFYDQQI